jgi:hypothetical protein
VALQSAPRALPTSRVNVLVRWLASAKPVWRGASRILRVVGLRSCGGGSAIEPISGSRLPNSGIIKSSLEIFGEIASSSAEFGNPETPCSRNKPATARFFARLANRYAETGIAGWRGSAGRTGLPDNSLLTGKLTGNFRNLALQCQSVTKKCLCHSNFLGNSLKMEQGLFSNEQGI